MIKSISCFGNSSARIVSHGAAIALIQPPSSGLIALSRTSGFYEILRETELVLRSSRWRRSFVAESSRSLNATLPPLNMPIWKLWATVRCLDSASESSTIDCDLPRTKLLAVDWTACSWSTSTMSRNSTSPMRRIEFPCQMGLKGAATATPHPGRIARISSRRCPRHQCPASGSEIPWAVRITTVALRQGSTAW